MPTLEGELKNWLLLLENLDLPSQSTIIQCDIPFKRQQTNFTALTHEPTTHLFLSSQSMILKFP